MASPEVTQLTARVVVCQHLTAYNVIVFDRAERVHLSVAAAASCRSEVHRSVPGLLVRFLHSIIFGFLQDEAAYCFSTEAVWLKNDDIKDSR